MPIPALSAGTDTAFAPPARSESLTYDYRSRDRRPFRAALSEAEAIPGAATTPFPPSAPGVTAPDGLGPAMAAGPVPAAGAAEQIHEGADALAALQRDLAGGGLLSLQEVTAPQEAAVPDATAQDAPAPDVSIEPAVAPAPGSWRDDDVKGRRLGDRAAPASDESGVETWLFGEDGFGFDDLLDVINPLQHIPVVSSIYRWITGDEISPAASVAGGALFGGPIGMAGAVAGVAVEEATGRDLGAHAIAMVFGEDEAPAAAPDFAALPDPAAAAAPQLAALAPEAGAPRAFTRDIPTSPLPALGHPVIFIPAATMPAGAAGGPEEAASVDDPVDAGPVPPVADAAIAAQMMDALNKYQALVQARVGSAPSMEPAAGSMVDTRL